jgi:hypothetical protein
LSTLRFGDDDWGIGTLEWNEIPMMGKFEEYFCGENWKETTPKLNSVILSLKGYDESKCGCLYREWATWSGESRFKRLCTENALQCDVIRDDWALEKWNSCRESDRFKGLRN